MQKENSNVEEMESSDGEVKEVKLSGKEFINLKSGEIQNSGYVYYSLRDDKSELAAEYDTKDKGDSFKKFTGRVLTYLHDKYPDSVTYETIKGDRFRDESDKDENYKELCNVSGKVFYSKPIDHGSLVRLFQKQLKYADEKHANEIGNYTIYYKVSSKAGTNSSSKKEKITSEKDVKVGDLIKNAIESNSQVIFTGAPGTGKTYSVHKFLEDKESFFVQFHPSYDYTDFVEGLRPAINKKDNKTTFVRLDGSFKGFCRKIVEDNLKYAYGEEWNSFSNDDKYQKLENLYESLKEKFKEKNALKQLEDNSNSPEYKFYVGNKYYYFFIDEINRADLSKVFGELMYGLEESYRGIQNRFSTQYSNLPTFEVQDDGCASEKEFDCFKKGFFIPYNLKIIGTMNDIDRSVESFDFALRRRFKWETVEANKVMKYSLLDILDKEILDVKKADSDGGEINVLDELCDNVKYMNELISKNENLGLSKAYHIGPAYFKHLAGNTAEIIEANLSEIFNKNIVSLIREYTRGRNEADIKKLLEDCADSLGVDLDE